MVPLSKGPKPQLPRTRLRIASPKPPPPPSSFCATKCVAMNHNKKKLHAGSYFSVSLIFCGKDEDLFTHSFICMQGEKELEAVTNLHTLCNSHQAAKFVTKPRCGQIRHLPSPKVASRLQWREELVAAVPGPCGPGQIVSSPARPILSEVNIL